VRYLAIVTSMRAAALACVPLLTAIAAVPSGGCGTCRFRLTSHPGCWWAAELGGAVVPVTGPALPQDHDDHGPEGMCNVTRAAVVSGRLYPTHFIATRFDLGPVEEPVDPSQVHVHDHQCTH
jgi:hypothetical protein